MFCFWITVPYLSLWIFIYDYILAHDTNVVQALLWMHQDEKHAGAKRGQHWATSTRETNNIIPNCSPGSYSSWQVPDFFPLSCYRVWNNHVAVDILIMEGWSCQIDLRRFPSPARKNSEHQGVSVCKFHYLKAVVSLVWRQGLSWGCVFCCLDMDCCFSFDRGAKHQLGWRVEQHWRRCWCLLTTYKRRFNSWLFWFIGQISMMDDVNFDVLARLAAN